MYLYSERLFHSGFREYIQDHHLIFQPGVCCKEHTPLYTFLPEFGRGCNAPFKSKARKALALP